MLHVFNFGIERGSQMKRILAILMLLLIALTGVIAAAETASEADIASIDSAAVEAVDEEASNEEASEEAAEPAVSRFYQTFWALLPPIIAIGLALITKEVYSSLFIGIVVGGLLYSNFSFEGTLNHVFSGGIVSVLSDTYNVGILVFLVILGILVCILNRAGGSAAFGRWAAQHIKTNVGAQLATIALGVLIFIDDYFNCLTVGSVMRPVCDKHKVSRAKLA